MSAYPFRQDVVLLEQVHCCALARACAQAAHQFLIRDLEKLLGTELVEIFKGIFHKTARLGFIPNQKARRFYAAIAHQEELWLKDHDRETFVCGHSSAEHKKALQKIMKMFAPRALN